MTNYNEIKAKIADEKEEMLNNMSDEEMEEYIHGICRKYYVAFMNEDVKEFNAAGSILADVKERYNNIDKFMNYSMLIAINSLLNELMDRKISLMIPDVVHIGEDDDPVVVNLFEKMKQKRQELYDLQNQS